MKFLFTVLILLPMVAFAQKQGNIWLFGEGAGLNFNSGIPVPVSGSRVYGSPSSMIDFLYSEGCSSISDSAGNLLFYSNGSFAWNRLHQPLHNSSGLMGFYSSAHAALIIPMPDSDSLFYLFTTSGMERHLAGGLRYSVVDMCLDSGNGGIISSEKNVLLLGEAGEKLAAARHPNGRDVWLIAHKHFTNAFYAYLITPTGINTPVITSIGLIHVGTSAIYNGTEAAIGQMKISSDGRRIALAVGNITPSRIEVLDFDPNTGVLSNYINLSPFPFVYGIEFSPDNTKLYFTGVGTEGVGQFDLTAGGGTPAGILGSKTVVSTYGCQPSGMQLAPNGKIYVARCSNTIAIINSPNNSGTASAYVENALMIPGSSSITSLPSFIAGYHYNNGIPDCGSAALCLPSIDSSEVTICNGHSFFAAGEYQTVPGSYFDTFSSTSGCDSIQVTLLTVSDSLSLTYSLTNATPGQQDGGVKVIVTGGNPPYQYSLDSIAFQSVNTFTDLDSGTYRIFVTDGNDCSTTGTFVIVSDSMVNAQSVRWLPIKVSPNPFSNALQIQLPEGADVTVKMIDVLGQEVFSSPYIHTSTIHLNTSQLPAGVFYLLMLDNDEKYLRAKVVQIKKE